MSTTGARRRGVEPARFEGARGAALEPNPRGVGAGPGESRSIARARTCAAPTRDVAKTAAIVVALTEAVAARARRGLSSTDARRAFFSGEYCMKPGKRE